MFNILDVSSEEVKIAGHSLSWWMGHYSLPLHISYSPIIRENLRAFKKVFDEYYPHGRICYATKACTHPAIFEIIKEEGAGADTASYYETKCALENGIDPELIDLNGNCKEDFLIEDAIEKNILIVADSAEEFGLVSEIAKKTGKRARTLLRISGYDLGQVTAEGVFTAGMWTKFGVPLKYIPEFIKSLEHYENIDLLGFHTHIGSQIADVEPYLAVIGKMIEMSLLLKETGRDCKIINIGGGYPVSYIDKETWEYVLNKIRESYVKSKEGDFSGLFLWNNPSGNFAKNQDGTINTQIWTGERFYTDYPKEKMLREILTNNIIVNGKTLNTVEALKSLGEPLLIIEPGRSIADDGGVSLAKVGMVRNVAGSNNLITLEMGVTSHSEALLENIIRRWEIVTDYHKKDDKPFETFIGGNLCFSGDMISRYKVSLQRKPSRGDILVVHDTGAYCSGFMEGNANSFPRSARVLVDENGNISLMKKRETYEEIFSL